jgi:TRAP-type transport system small permease protein
MSKPSFVLLVEAALDRIRALCLFVASLSLIVLIATFGWLVFGRYVLNVTPTWVEQLALLLICYVAFLGAAAGVQEDMMPPGVQKLIIIAIDLALAGFGAAMLIAGISLMQFGWDTMLPMLNIPESFRTLAITSCGALTLLFAGTRGLFRILTFQDWLPTTEHKES